MCFCFCDRLNVLGLRKRDLHCLMKCLSSCAWSFCIILLFFFVEVNKILEELIIGLGLHLFSANILSKNSFEGEDTVARYSDSSCPVAKTHLEATTCLVGVPAIGVVMFVTLLEKEVVRLRLGARELDEDWAAGGHQVMLGVKDKEGWSFTNL